MRALITSLAVWLVVAAPSIASAQIEVPLARVELEAAAPADIEDTGVRSRSTVARVTGLVPVPLAPRTVLLATPIYRYWRFVNDGARNISVHEIAGRLTIRQQLPRRWALLGSIELGLASDFKDFGADHLRVAGSAAAEHRFGPRLSLGAGVAANRNFGDFLVVPLVLVNWRPGPRFHLAVALPGFVRTTVFLSPNWRAGVAARLDGNRFAVQAAAVETESVALSQAALFARVERRLAGGLWGVAFVGHSVFRRTEIFDDDNESLADLSPDLALVGGVAVEFRVQPRRPPR